MDIIEEDKKYVVLRLTRKEFTTFEDFAKKHQESFPGSFEELFPERT
jgi:hypothetical protein